MARASAMRAYVLHGARDMRFEERSVPPVGDHDVRISVRRVGICGSDIHYYEHGYIGQFIPKAPFALGHEFSGVVDAVGGGVTRFKVGDRVTAEPSLACGTCRYCRSGRYNLCTSMRFFGSASSYPHIDGGFAQFVVAPEWNVFAVPDSLSFADAALIEPLAVGTHAVLRAGSLAGKSALITGGGTIGQTVLIAARAFGVMRAAVSDVAAYPRAFALKMGADAAFDPTAADFAEQTAAYAPGGFDVLFEASGSPRALVQCLQLAGRGATIVQIGTQSSEVTMPANLVMSKELTVHGSFRYAHVFPMIIDMLTTGRMNAEPLVTHVFPYTQMQAAMDLAVAKHDVIKVQVEH